MSSIAIKKTALRVHSLVIRCNVVDARGRRLFVKANESNDRDMKSFYRGELTRERVCLDVLRGFAVPNRVELTRKELSALTGTEPAFTIAQEMVVGKSLERVRLTPQQKIGAWFFLVEHLCAFRRNEILYSDVKPSNVVATSKPFRMTIVDFNTCTAVERGNRYPVHRIGRTPQFAAPEQGTLEVWFKESTCVYQLGATLTFMLSELGGGHWQRRRARSTATLERVLREAGAPSLLPLLLSCVADAPDERPRTYEKVLEKVKQLPNDPGIEKARAIWRQLRVPYEARLREVRL